MDKIENWVCCVNKNASISKVIKEILSDYFFNIYFTKEFPTIKTMFTQSNKPELLIVDILSDEGLDYIKEVRECDKNIPIIVLSQEFSPNNIFKLLEYGIQDFYKIPPFDADRFKKSIEKVYSNKMFYSSKSAISNKLALNPDTLEITLNDKKVKLTHNEKMLIKSLLKAKGKEIDPYILEYEIWGEELYDTNNGNRLRILVSRLNKKLDEKLVENIYGKGYIINI